MCKGQHTIGGVFAKVPFFDDMLETPRSNLDSMFHGKPKKMSKSRLEFAGGTGDRAFGFKPSACGPDFLIPKISIGR